MLRHAHHGPSSTRALANVALSVWAVLVALAVTIRADDWPFFRGPRFDGVSAETGWLTQWPESGPKIAWRKEVGIGVSSFAVVGNRVLTMGNQQDTDIVWCLDADSGRALWRFDYPCKFDARNFEGGTASTPTVDGQFVYALSYDGQVHCVGLKDGRTVWSRHLVRDFGGRYSGWKYAGSPLVTGNLVIFDTGADGKSTVALDKATGREVWSTGDDLAGYATPIPFTHAGERGVLVFKARAMVACNLATGRERWRIDWRSFYDCNASTPTVTGDQLFISTGYGGRSARGALFQLGPTPPRQLWLNKDMGTKTSSAVVHEGRVYCVSERSGGQLMCVDLKGGATVWAERKFAPYGTLMIAGGKLVVLEEKGDLVIADATAEGYHELARAKVLNGRCWVMPVLANGRIYAKTNKGQVVCTDVRVPRKP